jgi:hypothetical protein
MTASLLPIPDDPRFKGLIDGWGFFQVTYNWPRSTWLLAFEGLLREFYPSANSDSLTLTARHYAPFPLAAGHDVP